MIRNWVVAGALALAWVVSLEGQEQRPRLGVMGSPREGRPAPAVVAPYLTPSGPGPADQPFRLAAELGRVVILVIAGGVDSASGPAWRQVEDGLTDLMSPRVILVGAVRGSSTDVAELARGLRAVELEPGGPLPTKLLADADGGIHRAYGMGTRDRGWTTFVIADDGRIAAIVRGEPTRAAWRTGVEAGVRKGRTAP